MSYLIGANENLREKFGPPIESVKESFSIRSIRLVLPDLSSSTVCLNGTKRPRYLVGFQYIFFKMFYTTFRVKYSQFIIKRICNESKASFENSATFDQNDRFHKTTVLKIWFIYCSGISVIIITIHCRRFYSPRIFSDSYPQFLFEYNCFCFP